MAADKKAAKATAPAVAAKAAKAGPSAATSKAARPAAATKATKSAARPSAASGGSARAAKSKAAGSASAASGARLRVTQVRSTISHIARNRGTIRALGLHRIGDTVEVPANDATRGMVRQVRFLVEVEELPATPEEKA